MFKTKYLLVINNDFDFVNQVYKNSDTWCKYYEQKDGSLFQIHKDTKQQTKVELCLVDLKPTNCEQAQLLLDYILFMVEQSYNKKNNYIDNDDPMMVTDDWAAKKQRYKGIISSKINKLLYNQYQRTLEFVADIFISIVQEHILVDGNKRMGILMLQQLLSFIGCYTIWSSSREQYLDYWKNFVIDVVSYDRSNPEREQETINMIINKISDRIWLLL